jgi:hypothetical protein
MYFVSFSDGLYIYNTSNPQEPLLLSNVSGYGSTWSVFATENWVYVGDSYSWDLQIIDVSNKSSPKVEYVYNNLNYHDDLIVVGDVLYSASSSQIDILNVSDPKNPIVIEEYFSTYTHINSKLFFSNDYLYYFCDENGIDIIDVTNPATPIIKYRFAIVDEIGYIEDIWVENSIVYIVTWDGILYLYDVNNPSLPTLLNTWTQDDYFYDVTVKGNFTYVLGRDEIYCLNITNPEEPTLIGKYLYIETSYDFQLVGDYFYLFDYNGLNDLIDIDNMIPFTIPTTPTTPTITTTNESGLDSASTLLIVLISIVGAAIVIVFILSFTRKESVMEPKIVEKNGITKEEISEETIYCWKCGNANSSRIEYCQSCGELLQKNQNK